ncbi:MAG: hypothetical protein K2P21_10830 [Lachnospiraceae bacterium]|nr:hypothetical protein [Lachnospiraceae bacterium]
MRLIDADKFKKQIAGMSILNNYSADKANKMCELIDCQPTVYDVDKVVKRLEDMKYVMMGNYGVRREVVSFDDLIEIVKSGGIE